MKLSTRAEYGIRVLVALARAEGDRPLPLAQIARAERLPHAYIEQLVGALRRAGLVSATRGQAGGYRLSRPAEQINLAEAVRALDGPIRELPCAGPDNLGAGARPRDCSVHAVFARLHDSLSGTLTATTVAEVAAEAGGPPYPAEVRRRIQAAANGKSTQAAQ
jgi:Rrf2 family cysteine metabolism transcriptional repressor